MWGGRSKRNVDDYLDYYYNEKGNVIKVYYTDWRRVKPYLYEAYTPEGRKIGHYFTLKAAQAECNV